MVVNIPAPARVTKGFEGFYTAHSYEPQRIEAHTIRKVFLNRSGICLKRMQLVKESVPPYPHLWRSFHIIALASYWRRKLCMLSPHENYVICHNIWSMGYFHWITEALPRFLALSDIYDSYTLLIPSGTKIQPVIEDTVALLGVKIERLDQDSNYRVDNLTIPTPVRQAEYAPTSISRVASLCKKHYQDVSDGHGSLIYISRKRANRRKVVNEAAVEDFLARRGFTIVNFEDHSFAEQVAMMSRAKLVISIHGAGLTNILFMPQGGFVIELLKRPVPKVDVGRVRRTFAPSPSYWRLSAICGLQYLAQVCDPEDASVPHDQANLFVSLDELGDNLRLAGVA